MRFITTLATTLALGLFALTAVACGGDSDSSGLDGSTVVSTLDTTDRETLCEFVVDAAGGAGTEFTCPDDVTVTVQSEQDCLDSITADTTCTVAQLENCALADPCDLGPCLPLLECL